jgi:hypothetical protein
MGSSDQYDSWGEIRVPWLCAGFGQQGVDGCAFAVSSMERSRTFHGASGGRSLGDRRTPPRPAIPLHGEKHRG